MGRKLLFCTQICKKCVDVNTYIKGGIRTVLLWMYLMYLLKKDNKSKVFYLLVCLFNN